MVTWSKIVRAHCWKVGCSGKAFCLCIFTYVFSFDEEEEGDRVVSPLFCRHAALGT